MVTAISGSVFPTGISTPIKYRYNTNPTIQITMFVTSIASDRLSARFRIKKSAIWIAIIGANTEPIRYRKSVILSIGYTIAPTVPITVTATAAYFPFSLENTDSAEMPAEYASRNVVVTVENTMINSPAIPSHAFTMI